MEYISVGFFNRPHGLKGEIKLNIEDLYLDDVLEAQAIFVKIKGIYQPFFVEHIRGEGQLLCKIENIDSSDAARLVAHQEVFLREQDISKETLEMIDDEEITFSVLVGFEIIDEYVGKIGVIKEVLEMPTQELAVVDFNGKEVLIPMHEQIITAINEQKKTVTTILPEGLLEL